MRQWVKITLLVIVVYIVWTWLGRKPIESFQASPTVIALPTTIKCPAQQIGTVKQFLCESEEEATKLMTGPTNKAQTYLAPGDQVCVTDDKESGIYSCKDLNLPPESDDIRFKLVDDYDLTCNNIVKNYLDISSNLVSLMSMKDVISNSTQGIEKAQLNLNTLYMNMKCAGMTQPGRSKTICDAIKSGLDEIKKQGTITEGTLKQVTDPIQKMVDSRASLKGNIDAFRCDL